MAKTKARNNNKFYQEKTEGVLQKFDTSKEGLKPEEATKRLQQEGPNELPQEESTSFLQILLDQFKSPLIYILVFAGFVTLFLGNYTDSIVIFAAVFLNTGVGFFQEKKASNALKKLKNVLTVKAVAWRGGQEKKLPQKDLVPGDIILLRAGDKVPADARVLDATNLKVNESALTGEWKPAKKQTNPLEEGTPLPDRDNMVYMGTSVEDGEAKAVVTETGPDTELGRIASLVSESKEDKTPYQKRLHRFSKLIGIAVAFICVGIFAEGVIFGGEFLEMFETAIAVAVASIPEGLPVAMTVILAIGMQRILERKGLVRKLVSAETLGSTSIICTDKTGTLTKAQMQTEAIYDIEGNEVGMEKKIYNRILRAGVFSNEAFIENPQADPEEWKLSGTPTEKAVLTYATKQELSKNKLLSENKQIDKVPFSSSYKYSASLNEKDGHYQLSAMGAPETLLKRAKYYQTDGEVKKMDKEKRKRIRETNDELTSRGLRVVAVGYKKVNEDTYQGELRDQVGELIFLGFIGLHDPIREDVKESITICKDAGMRPVIVTGDHKLTAKSVAEKLGFKINEDEVMTGGELSQLNEAEFKDRFKDIKIYARVEPAQKMRIIKAWQEKGEVVAMTGDGVNDGPAIKKADVGIAQGSGTDVAQEVADLVLLNDSFSIIVAAVEEGRAILSNIRRVITYLLTGSFTEIVIISVSIIVGWPLPVTAVQILWVNLVEDGLPAIALAFEEKEKGLMDQEPTPKHASLLTLEMKVIIFLIGAITDAILLAVFWWLYSSSGYSIARVQTVMFAALGLDSIFYVFSCRSLKRNVWHLNPFRNKFLVGAVVGSFFFIVLGVYFPFFQYLLNTVPLTGFEWVIVAMNSLLMLAGIEATKWFFIVRRQNHEV